MSETSPLLEIRHVSKTYDLDRSLSDVLARKPQAQLAALRDVSLTVRPNEILGVVGESGCGKSTLGRCIVGLDRADHGTFAWQGGAFATDRSARARQIQMVFQDPYASLNPNWKVGSLVAEGMRVHDVVPPHQRRDRAAELLERCGLPGNVLDRYPHEFSGGQRQRICIARALAVEPRILILDEPVSALDVSIQAQILLLLQQLQRDMGLTYVFISHDLAVVSQMCDRVAVMKAGKFVEVGPIADVIHRPRDPYTQALIGATPVPDPSKRRKSTHQGRTIT